MQKELQYGVNQSLQAYAEKQRFGVAHRAVDRDEDNTDPFPDLAETNEVV